MLYSLKEIEDQIVDSLRTLSVTGSEIDVRTHAGEVNPRMFLDPSMLEGFISRLPFLYIQYQGRNSAKNDRDSTGQIYFHTLKFRIYVGAQSLREKKEAQRSAYSMLASIYDTLHAKWIASAAYTLAPGRSHLTGAAITAATLTTPIDITVAGHGKSTGDTIFIEGVQGMTELNNTSGNPYWTVTKLNATQLRLTGSAGTHAWTSGGTIIAAITTANFPTPQGFIAEAGGDDERLIVNLPQITVYSSDWTLKLIA